LGVSIACESRQASARAMSLSPYSRQNCQATKACSSLVSGSLNMARMPRAFSRLIVGTNPANKFQTLGESTKPLVLAMFLPISTAHDVLIVVASEASLVFLNDRFDLFTTKRFPRQIWIFSKQTFFTLLFAYIQMCIRQVNSFPVAFWQKVCHEELPSRV